MATWNHFLIIILGLADPLNTIGLYFLFYIFKIFKDFFKALICFTLCGCVYVLENIGGEGVLFRCVYFSSPEFFSKHDSSLSFSDLPL